MNKKIVDWNITFEREDGSEVQICEALGEKDAEYIDDEIAVIVSEKGLWSKN